MKLEKKSDLNEIKRSKNKSNEQWVLYNIDMLCKARNTVTNFFGDYSLMVSEAKYKTINALI